MAGTDLESQLSLLGLSAPAVAVYRSMLNAAPISERKLIPATDLTAATVAGAVRELLDIGLAAPTGTRNVEYVPVSPSAAIDALASRRQFELQQARMATLQAYETFRRSVYNNQYHDDLVEVVSGDAILHRIDQLTKSVRRRIRRLDSPPYFVSATRNELEESQLDEGISYRCVYSKVSLQNPGYFADNILPCLQHGEEARVLPEVPVKLTIYDDSAAIVSLTIKETDRNRSMLIVRPCSLYSALEGLFETAWNAGIPLDHSGTAAGRRLKPVERRLLTLLAAGLKDEEIAGELGVSRRTFFRHLEVLMAHTGASSRFQLALHAARNNWL